ncbi:MAG: hypothetical protein H0T90_08230, partial [Gemmatimonadales bacterium]|nr:hypothetical protein [Gemmatimonadales bacterium]
IMPSKTLQYLRAARPILAFLDRGGMIRDVLRTERQGYLVRRDEPARVGGLIATLASAPRRHRGEPSAAVAAYSRREIARRFAEVLDTTCQRPESACPPLEPATGPTEFVSRGSP